MTHRRYIAENNIEHEKRSRNRYNALLRVPRKYANEELSRAEFAIMPLWDWRHVPDPAEAKNAFVAAWKDMQCQNHHRELTSTSSLCECITPDGVFMHPAVHHCDDCRYAEIATGGDA
uniref:Uncharacterized protein n=1 Tax=Candidatus Methanogaster sp. ANME-2c ERB4 TaxID=2759911 RepID=A0A7G9Y3I4_9EURY|nr:hypothetical protein HEBJAHIM_00004 [Methanosarcinales archaeon ANME-2c ERB4]QNO42117.1 hypothetical protein INBEEEIC_00019 [Methanosarcinales archaeon ANME-2c ERB4]QNO42275.1 hypothetical protein CCKMDOMK_00004 [Methanosarcinales archaeon ANME-2c ERB4]QNO42483.1 hypothetical protein LBOOMNCC_00036 [Methanosarcinales archaeon ANME-2c ERB4]QNO42568.1 hypothetical protein MMDHCPHC_00004 [Methanosarcinales archaeon ANME-2c ERB4]